jgi:hypothetical protein
MDVYEVYFILTKNCYVTTNHVPKLQATAILQQENQ